MGFPLKIFPCRKIQSVFELSDGSGIVVTVARYETPAHIDIDKVFNLAIRRFSIPITVLMLIFLVHSSINFKFMTTDHF